MCLYSSVNREIYEHVAGVCGRGSHYIPRLCVIKEYIPIYSSVRCNRGPTNIIAYIHQRYIPRLTEKYTVYLLVMKVCSSIITDERVRVSCSVVACPPWKAVEAMALELHQDFVLT
jgi:hypothetical protein